MLSKQSPFRQMLRFRVKKGSSLKSWQVAALIVFSYLILPYLIIGLVPIFILDVPFYVFLGIAAVLVFALHLVLSKVIRPQLTSSLRPAQVGMLWALPLGYTLLNILLLAWAAVSIAFGAPYVEVSGIANGDRKTALLFLGVGSAANVVISSGLLFGAYKTVARSLRIHALNEQSAEAIFENTANSELRKEKLSKFARGIILFYAVALSLLFIWVPILNFELGFTVIGLIDTILVLLEVVLIWIIYTGYRFGGLLRAKQIAIVTLLPLELIVAELVEYKLPPSEQMSMLAYIAFMVVFYVPLFTIFCWYAFKRLPHEHDLPKGKPSPKAIF